MCFKLFVRRQEMWLIFLFGCNPLFDIGNSARERQEHSMWLGEILFVSVQKMWEPGIE